MQYKKTTQNTIKRGNKKACYDVAVINKILDSNEICHIAFTVEGKAHTQPINFGRKENTIYIHGSHKNRMTDAILKAGEVVLSVFMLDGMRLSRCAYSTSVNFHSAIIFGKARNIENDEEKLVGLKTIINHFVPEHWEHCREPNKKELKSTRVVEIKILSASAKVANSPINDSKEDLTTDYWAGTIPVTTTYGKPISCSALKEGVDLPEHIINFISKKKR
jgi:uncharacterized protein